MTPERINKLFQAAIHSTPSDIYPYLEALSEESLLLAEEYAVVGDCASRVQGLVEMLAALEQEGL